MTKRVKLMTKEEHEEHKKHNNAYQKQYRKDNPEKIARIIKKYHKTYRYNMKKNAVDAYSGRCWFIDDNGMQCEKDSNNDIKSLRTHHAKCDGPEHRADIFKGKDINGTGWYKWLRDNGYPQDLHLEILCVKHHAKVHRLIEKMGADRGDFTDPVWLKKQYIDNQLSLLEISELCICSMRTIKNQLKEFDISRL